MASTTTSTVVEDQVVCEGWVLKKRRKIMQGFARRYFTLYQSGILSYSFEPGQPIRDSVVLQHAAISTAPGRKDIHVDSGTATFHIKCLSTADFNDWMSALRKFIVPEGRRSSSVRGTPRISQLNKSGMIVEEMGLTLAELENAISSLYLDNSLHTNCSRSSTRLDKKQEGDKQRDRGKEGGSVFGLFKKGHHHNAKSESVNEIHTELQRASSQIPSTSQQRVQAVLELLKSQHVILLQSVHALSSLDTNPATARASPLPSTAEEDEHHFRDGLIAASFTRAPTRASTISSLNEWFDASDGYDGAEEFILEVPEEQASKMTRTESSTTQVQESDSDADTDSEEDHALEMLKSLSIDRTGEVNTSQIARRTQLPARPIGDEGSLFAVLKKNVGKDLSTVTFPVTFNEPLTLLQRSAEEVEYYDLLRQAAESDDPVERLSYVAAFAVSGYAHTRHRSSRKGFNPMLAETFEDARMKFIAEKVCHHPLVMAYHAEGDGWELSATSAGKTKFWGKSLEIIPLGITRLKIGDDHYQWKKPSSFMRNIMVGTKYLEHCGKMTIETTTNHSYCVLEFKQSGYFGPSNVVSGTIHSSSGEAVSHLEGRWDDQIAQTLDSSHLKVLWRMAPFPKNSPEYYGFTSYGMTINEITSDIEGKLPPTDSRNRPDVRALENGDTDTAENEKTRVEEMQRTRRKNGTDCQPRWFKEVGEEWVYVGGYWEQRARSWKDSSIEPLCTLNWIVTCLSRVWCRDIAPPKLVWFRQLELQNHDISPAIYPPFLRLL